jgi:hypothetical protein
VTGEVVHDDGVARFQERHDVLFNASDEEIAGDRAVDDERGDHPVKAEPGDEGGRFPVAVGHVHDQAFSAGRPAMGAGQVGARPRFVEEEPSRRVDGGLSGFPVVVLHLDIGTILVAGADGLFSRQSQDDQRAGQGRFREGDFEFSWYSARVASGVAATAAKICSAYVTQPGVTPRRLCGVGPICCLALQRCLNCRTHAGLSEYFWATADVVIPATQSVKILWHKSIENVFMGRHP